VSILLLLIVIGTSIWVGFDAQKNKISTSNTKPYSLNTGAVVWAGFCLLFWIITFPVYLYRRNKVLSARRPSSVPTATASNSAAPVMDLDQQLRQLAKLKADGIITEEDFERKKKALLAL
jgi:hypothetical protein